MIEEIYRKLCLVMPLSLSDDISATEMLYRLQHKLNEVIDVVNKLVENEQKKA